MKKLLYTIVFAILFITTSTAQQFDLSAEVRPRYENKHGYKTLISTGADGSNFVSQRTRLNFGYENNKLKLYISMQNVSIWGDKSTLAAQNNTGVGIGTSLHEAWAAIKLTNDISLKMGRQEIVYDDHRIFGSVGWAQQARSHDAFVFTFLPNKNNQFDVGLALNADGQGGLDALYSNIAGYKSFQYAWYHRKFDKFGLSFLFLNTGIEYDTSGKQKIDYMQTIGPRLTYKSGKLNANAAVYFQTGKTINKKVSSLYLGGNIGYKIADNFSARAGLEYLSGKDMDDNSTDINSFAPLFGTNHKFNGWMDYFYVGNHGNSVGLTDINFTLAYKKDKFSAKLIPHFFSAPSKVYNNVGTKMNANLGTEIDFTVSYKIAKDIRLSTGYSKMFATETLEVLKNGDKDENNSWGWIMFTFKPKLFSYTPSTK